MKGRFGSKPISSLPEKRLRVEDLKVVDKAELLLDSGERILAYVAGRWNKDKEIVIYNTVAEARDRFLFLGHLYPSWKDFSVRLYQSLKETAAVKLPTLSQEQLNLPLRVAGRAVIRSFDDKFRLRYVAGVVKDNTYVCSYVCSPTASRRFGERCELYFEEPEFFTASEVRGYTSLQVPLEIIVRRE